MNTVLTTDKCTLLSTDLTCIHSTCTGVGREMARGTGEFTIYMYLYEKFVAGAHISNSYMYKVGNIPYPTIRQSFYPFSLKDEGKRTKEKLFFFPWPFADFFTLPAKRIVYCFVFHKLYKAKKI